MKTLQSIQFYDGQILYLYRLKIVSHMEHLSLFTTTTQSVYNIELKYDRRWEYEIKRRWNSPVGLQEGGYQLSVSKKFVGVVQEREESDFNFIMWERQVERKREETLPVYAVLGFAELQMIHYNIYSVSIHEVKGETFLYVNYYHNKHTLSKLYRELRMKVFSVGNFRIEIQPERLQSRQVLRLKAFGKEKAVSLEVRLLVEE